MIGMDGTLGLDLGVRILLFRPVPQSILESRYSGV